MRTNVRETSINTFHNIVSTFAKTQEDAILAHVAKHGDCTIGEIAHALKMEKSTVSARQHQLRKDGFLVFGADRKCNRSGVMCSPLRLPVRQLGLFQ